MANEGQRWFESITAHQQILQHCFRDKGLCTKARLGELANPPASGAGVGNDSPGSSPGPRTRFASVLCIDKPPGQRTWCGSSLTTWEYGLRFGRQGRGRIASSFVAAGS